MKSPLSEAALETLFEIVTLACVSILQYAIVRDLVETLALIIAMPWSLYVLAPALAASSTGVVYFFIKLRVARKEAYERRSPGSR